MNEPLNDLQVQIRHTCPSCKGTGLQKNPDHDPHEIFPQNLYDPCMHCHGRKAVEEWVPVSVFLQSIAELDIQF
jgi:DnaJ-class molecular chaperone